MITLNEKYEILQVKLKYGLVEAHLECANATTTVQIAIVFAIAIASTLFGLDRL